MFSGLFIYVLDCILEPGWVGKVRIRSFLTPVPADGERRPELGSVLDSKTRLFIYNRIIEPSKPETFPIEQKVKLPRQHHQHA